MKIIIIGGGKNGSTLANLLGEKHEITIIESDEKIAKGLIALWMEVSDTYKAQAFLCQIIKPIA